MDFYSVWETIDGRAIVIALIAAIPPSLLALFGWLKGRANGKTAAETHGVVGEIHHAVNSQRDEMQREIMTLRETVMTLRNEILDLKKTAIDSLILKLTPNPNPNPKLEAQ